MRLAAFNNRGATGKAAAIAELVDGADVVEV